MELGFGEVNVYLRNQIGTPQALEPTASVAKLSFLTSGFLTAPCTAMFPSQSYTSWTRYHSPCKLSGLLSSISVVHRLYSGQRHLLHRKIPFSKIVLSRFHSLGLGSL